MNKTALRILLDLSILLSVVNGWWLVAMIISIIASWRFDNFFEVIIAGVIFDSLFGYNLNHSLFGYAGTFSGILIFVLVMLSKKTLRR